MLLLKIIQSWTDVHLWTNYWQLHCVVNSNIPGTIQTLQIFSYCCNAVRRLDVIWNTTIKNRHNLYTRTMLPSTNTWSVTVLHWSPNPDHIWVWTNNISCFCSISTSGYLPQWTVHSPFPSTSHIIHPDHWIIERGTPPVSAPLLPSIRHSVIEPSLWNVI